jgi:tryptophan-rich sensory protein
MKCMKKNEVLKLIFAVLISEFAGLVGSLFTFPSIVGWYAGLRKPWFTPPNWLFGPVWVTLYFLMGVSLYLVWKKGIDRKGARRAVGMFCVQLALNALWSVLFFGLHSALYGLICIAALWVAILATMVAFYGVSKKAVVLLLPYILWVTVAMALNYYVWLLN